MACRGHVEVCELLIETGGADVNVRRKSDGMTAVYMAATSGHTDCCQVIARGRVSVGRRFLPRVIHMYQLLS